MSAREPDEASEADAHMTDERVAEESSSSRKGTQAASRGLVGALPEIAVGAGFAGLLLYPWLIGLPTARYLILTVDLLALTLGLWLLWRALRRSARYDMAIAALVTSGVSLYLFISYVTGPPPAPGGT